MGIAIAGLIASIIGGIAAYSNQRRATNVANQNVQQTLAANKSMAEYAHSKDVEMWNASNAYNSPEAQRLRLDKAGLNPNLVYGSGTVGGNTSGQMPKYNAPTQEFNYEAMPVPGESLPSMLTQFQDISMRQAQIDNVRANTKAVGQRTVNDAITERILGLKEYGEPYRNAILGTQARFADSMAEYSLEAKRGNVRLQGAMNQKLLADIDVSRATRGMIESRVKNIDEDTLIKRFQNQWSKEGVTGRDNIMLRMLIRQFPDLFTSIFK